MNRKEVKEELLQDPEYARIAALPAFPTAIEYNVSLFTAFKVAFGYDKTVQDWTDYTLNYNNRKHYETLVELINEQAYGRTNK
jgi:hypothetical protein